MAYDDIKTGSVVHYQFLWQREAQRGEEEGRKRRPTAVIFRLDTATVSKLWLLPVTTKEPANPLEALEVTAIEAKRLGLDTSIRRWIVLTEANYDELPQSVVLEPGSKIGDLSAAFHRQLLVRFRDQIVKKAIVRRTP